MIKRNMKIFILFLFFAFASAHAQSQNVEVIKWNVLEKMIALENDTTYIFNFWATWCKPCVNELPNFEKITGDFKVEKVKVYLVALDFKKDLNARVIPFVRKHKLQSTVLLLDEKDYDLWIDKVDKSWSGAIPATLIKSKDKRIFLEKELTYNELKSNIIPFIH